MSIRDSYREIKGFIRSKPTLPQDPNTWLDVEVEQKSKNIWQITVDTGETDTYSANFRKGELSFKALYDVAQSVDKSIPFSPQVTIHSPGKGSRPEATPTTAADVRRAMKVADDKQAAREAKALEDLKATGFFDPLPKRVARSIRNMVRRITRRFR